MLILNDEELEDKAKITFDKNLEKVVDLALVYEPTAAESVAIAVPDVAGGRPLYLARNFKHSRDKAHSRNYRGDPPNSARIR